jgi:hypothetical protein
MARGVLRHEGPSRGRIQTPNKPSNYPLKTCIVTDNELGSMGKVVTKVYDGQEIKFCCKPCVGKFEKNPAKYLSKLN